MYDEMSWYYTSSGFLIDQKKDRQRGGLTVESTVFLN